MRNSIQVWDPLVRIFHWGLVLTFFISYFTGEEESNLHIYAGYAVLGLIIFRLLWGFIGTEHARFSDFITSPATVINYLKSLADKPRHYIGHNPAGGWMVIVMLVTLFVVSYSGLKVYAIEEGLGPLAGQPELTPTIISTAYADGYEREHDDDDHEGHEENEEDDEAEEFWEEIHEASANFMLLLIFLHIAGVIIGGRLHDENLIKAMLTGKKEISR